MNQGNRSMTLKYSGRTLPEWADSQMEVLADQLREQEHTVWNVEEHRYTTSELIRPCQPVDEAWKQCSQGSVA